MASTNSHSSPGGNPLEGQFQNLQLGENLPPAQQGLAHPLPDPPISSLHDIAYEPPPGPPPNWKPRAEKPPVTPNSPASNPLKSEQVSSSCPANSTAPTSVRPHPSGVFPLTQCAKSAVGLDLVWFYYPSIGSFHVCSYCYTQHIYNTQFQQLFQRTQLEATGAYKCHFGSARMKDIWPIAVSSGDVDPVLQFMKNRATIPDCQLTKQLERESWYVCQDLQGMTLCRACFEDTTMRPVFRKRFTLKAKDAAYCDMSMGFIVRMFDRYKETGTWESFVGDVATRLSIGSCPRTELAPGAGRVWLQTRQNHSHPTLKICAACYMDFFVHTPSEVVFEKASEVWEYLQCDVGSSYLLVAALAASDKHDLNTFWKALRAMRSQPQCTSEGIQGGNWYTLVHKPLGFSVCGSCYASLVEPIEQGHHFTTTHHTSGRTLCSFNPSHGRSKDYLINFSKTTATGDLKYIGDYATKYAAVLICPRYRSTNGKNGKFWGWDKLTICEQCYIDFAKGTSLESSFVIKGNPDPEGKMCDLYSPRMRKLYSDACMTGDLDGLLHIACQRRDVWRATIPAIDQIESNLQAAAFQANMHRQSSSFYNFLGNSVQNTIGSNYTVGNLYAGYGHANEYLLTGQTHQRQAQTASLQAMDGSSWSRVSILKQQWAEVE